MQLNAKQIDAAAFLARVRTEPMPALHDLAAQMNDEECGELLALREGAASAVQEVLAKAAKRRESEEAAKLAKELATELAKDLTAESAEESPEEVEDETAVLEETPAAVTKP